MKSTNKSKRFIWNVFYCASICFYVRINVAIPNAIDSDPRRSMSCKHHPHLLKLLFDHDLPRNVFISWKLIVVFMITFTLSQSVWEFVKLRAIRAMRLVWSMCPCVNLPTCQKRANFSFLRANVPKNVPTCQRRTSYSTWCANVLKANQSFNYF